MPRFASGRPSGSWERTAHRYDRARRGRSCSSPSWDRRPPGARRHMLLTLLLHNYAECARARRTGWAPHCGGWRLPGGGRRPQPHRRPAQGGHAGGYLTLEEVDQRLGAALAARTRGELDRLVATCHPSGGLPRNATDGRPGRPCARPPPSRWRPPGCWRCWWPGLVRVAAAPLVTGQIPATSVRVSDGSPLCGAPLHRALSTMSWNCSISATFTRPRIRPHDGAHHRDGQRHHRLR